jgi:hypothetical protein
MKVIETRPVVVTSGYRTSAKQAALENGGGKYAQGAAKVLVTSSIHHGQSTWYRVTT